MGYTSKYEQGIINDHKEWAFTNDIPFSAMTEIIIINTIRRVKKDIANKSTEIVNNLEQDHK